MYRIRCKCGHEAPIDEFMQTVAGIDLPANQYQCRQCGDAWAVRQVAAAWVAPSGFVHPATLACVPVDRTL